MEAADLLSHQEPVDDLPCDQRREEARLGRGVQEPDEPYHGVRQARVQSATKSTPRTAPSTAATPNTSSAASPALRHEARRLSSCRARVPHRGWTKGQWRDGVDLVQPADGYT